MPDLWTSLVTLVLLLVGSSAGATSNNHAAAWMMANPRTQQPELLRELTSTVLTTTTTTAATTPNDESSSSTTSQRIRACEAASREEYFETTESIQTHFYYELVLEKQDDDSNNNSDPVVVHQTASAISSLVAEYLTSAFVLTNCRISTPLDHHASATGAIRAVVAAPSRVVSRGPCGRPPSAMQSISSTSSLYCYRIVGSNTVFLEDQDPTATVDVDDIPALQNSLSHKVFIAFGAWIPMLGGSDDKETGIHSIRQVYSESELEELANTNYYNSQDDSNTNESSNDTSNADWGQWPYGGGSDTSKPEPRTFQSINILVKFNFFYAMFLMGVLLVSLALVQKHPGGVKHSGDNGGDGGGDDHDVQQSASQGSIFGMLLLPSGSSITRDRKRRAYVASTGEEHETSSSSEDDEGATHAGDTATANNSSTANESSDNVSQDNSNPFSSRGGQALVWSNVNMTLSGKGDEPDRKLLDNIWGEVPPKQTTAIMGPSGAGKTSLLNILSGRACSRGRVTVDAEIRLNNYAVDPTSIEVRHMIAFVAQDDSLQMTATPREAIRFSAKLRLPGTTTERELDKLTTQMLTELGLNACADTIVGGPLLKGISGGERKRTSVGVELVVRPSMVFLDEPTSGLDSFSAVQVCQVLTKVADAGATVLFTIHQPSSEIFTSFDNLILLNRGRVMYQGPSRDVTDYFATKGFRCPKKFNPADFVMNVAQETSIGELEDAGFFPPDERHLDEPLRVNHGQSLHSVLSDDNGATPLPAMPSALSIGGLVEVLMLFIREMVNVRRDPAILTPRTTMVAIVGTMIGIIFFKVGETSPADTSNLQSHFGAMIVLVTFAIMSTAQPTLLTFPDERPVFIREYSTRHYSVISYFMSRLAVEAMLTALQMFIMALICYYMAGFQGTFVVFYTTCYCLAMTSTALASVVGAATGGNGELSLQFMPILFAPQMLFTGYFVAPDLIPSWLAWLQYVFPAAYAVRLLIVEEFDQCSTDPLELINCIGLMESLSVSADDTWWYWLILGCQFVVFRVLALAILHANALRFY